MADTATSCRQDSPHFFRREADGSVRLRIRFTPDEAALIEEAAGQTPLMLDIHRSSATARATTSASGLR